MLEWRKNNIGEGGGLEATIGSINEVEFVAWICPTVDDEDTPVWDYGLSVVVDDKVLSVEAMGIMRYDTALSEAEAISGCEELASGWIEFLAAWQESDSSSRY